MSRDNNGTSPLTAGIIGGLIGVMAGATAVLMSDKKNREKVKEAVHDMESAANQKLDELKDVASGAEEQSRKKLATNLRKLATQLDKEEK
jgi:gas vesicle protein